MKPRVASLFRSLGLSLLLAGPVPAADNPASVAAQLAQLADENRRLHEQLSAQQQSIDRLAAQVQDMRAAAERHDRDLAEMKEQDDRKNPAHAEAESPAVRVGGQAGLAFFHSGAAGQFPASEFRVDDARITVEAQVWKNAYLFSELELLTREASDEAVHFGELYADFEDVSGLWDQPDALNLRVGRFNIPFGEEYQTRYVLSNPLISHSLSDVWGYDEGVEAYGRLGPLHYVVAVQNGGRGVLHDYNADKSVAGRVGYDPAAWLHLSASALRTGELSAKSDVLSEVWFANGFFRALGPQPATTTFQAKLYELDGTARWSSGHLTAAAGWADFDDNNPAGGDPRHFNYRLIEAVQNLGGKLYAAARYSAIDVPHGYPLVGWGNFGNYFFAGPLTQNLERWSLGLGYRIGPPLILKFEYTLERGRLASGIRRPDDDVLSTELGLKF